VNTSRRSPDKLYLDKGSTLMAYEKRQDAIWGGENIQRGRGIFKRGAGSSGVTISASPGTTIVPSGPGSPQNWPFKVYNTSVGPTGQVQINGGDGFVAQLGFIANVNGSPNDTKIGSPPAYPQLPVSGNGPIYAYGVPVTPGVASPLQSLDIYYAGTLPATDSANPQTYFVLQIATITGYTIDPDTEKVSFQVNNATSTGWASLFVCGGIFQMY
jgi:hypothetical protein